MDLEEVSFETLAGGGLVELYDEAMRQLLENIADPATERDAKREFQLKVTVKPDEEDREGPAAVVVELKTKLAAPRARAGFMFPTKRKAYHNDPRQLEFTVMRGGKEAQE